jgi:hypothetical protein
MGLFVLLVGCGSGPEITATALPTEGTVTAAVSSAFGLDDNRTGVDLPAGLQLNVLDAQGTPVADALVHVWPGGRSPQSMTHEGNGTYQVDILTGRLEPPKGAYFFEVESEWLVPTRVVVRVPHAALTGRPTIVEPEADSDQPLGQALQVEWRAVSGATCYDVATRTHSLQDWTTQMECETGTQALLPGEIVRDFTFIRVRARGSQGDASFETAPYVSKSHSDAQVRIFLSESP